MSDTPHSNGNYKNGLSKFQFIPSHTFEERNIESEGLDPKKIISIIFQYKWLVLFLLVAGTVSAWIYSEYATPIYKSTGTLMVSSSDGSDDELSQIISQATGVGTSTTLVNELQVLQSRTFSRQVARKLIEDDPGTIEDYPILWTVDEENNGVFKSDESMVANRIRRNISFKQPEQEADVIDVSFESPSPREARKIVNTAMEIYVENSTQQNRQAAQSTAEFLEKEKEEIKKKLQESEENLRKFMDNTGIVQVNEQATSMVNQKAETESELQRVELELETIQETITNYETQLEKIKPGLSEQFSKAIGPRIRNKQQELANYETEKTLIITKNPGVQNRNPVPPRLTYLNEQIERLKSEIKDLSDQLFSEEELFLGFDSEERATRIAEIQSRLVELRIQQNQFRSREEALRQHKKDIDASFDSLPEGMTKLAKLQRDVRINEELYLNLSRQYADMSVWKQSQFGFGRIIDPAPTPGIPVSPNKKLLILVGLFLGGVLSAGFIFFKEFFDNSVNSVEQLRTVYHPSLTLTTIPSFEKKTGKNNKYFKVGNGKVPEEIIILDEESNIAAEAIRRLKNNLVYQYDDNPPKTIAVTSPEKGDGKTTIVANLGIAFAEEGYKTLIIDTDLRRPKLQKYLGISNNAGLSDYLDGKISIRHLIQNSNFYALKVITAGRQINKPENITGSKEFKQLISKMEEVFDIIILDTPPFGVISDSAPILKNAETTLLVARYRKTNKGMLVRTLEELGQIHANVANIVLNDFDHRKEAGTYYGSGYYKSLYENYEEYLS